MMLKIDMTALLGEALRATGAEQASILHSGISVQAEIKLRVCFGEKSMGQDEAVCAVQMEGDVIYGGEGKQQEPVGGIFSESLVQKKEKR